MYKLPTYINVRNQYGAFVLKKKKKLQKFNLVSFHFQHLVAIFILKRKKSFLTPHKHSLENVDKNNPLKYLTGYNSMDNVLILQQHCEEDLNHD